MIVIIDFHCSLVVHTFTLPPEKQRVMSEICANFHSIFDRSFAFMNNLLLHRVILISYILDVISIHLLLSYVTLVLSFVFHAQVISAT
jgi:hypothetical protein